MKNFEFELKDYLYAAWRFSHLRDDRNAKLGELNDLYTKLCNDWASIIPDACLNKMIDTEGKDFELNAINTVAAAEIGGGMVELAVDGLVNLAKNSRNEKDFFRIFL